MSNTIEELKQELQQLYIMKSYDIYTKRDIRRIKILERIIKQYNNKE